MKITSLLATVLFGSALTAQAGILATYNFNGNVNPTNNEPTWQTVTAFTTSFGISLATNNQDYGPSGIQQSWGPTPLSGAVNAATALSNNSFVQFTITPLSGGILNLDEISFDGARGGSSTPRGFGLASSVDSFATVIGSHDMATARAGGLLTYSFDLSAPAFQGITTPITFRVLVYAPGTGNSVEMNSLSVLGTIPEPSTYAAIAGALALGLVAYRRRR